VASPVSARAGAVFGKTGFTCDAGYTAAMLVERAQKLARKRIRVRVMAPRKVVRAGFEPG